MSVFMESGIYMTRFKKYLLISDKKKKSDKKLYLFLKSFVGLDVLIM